MPPRSEAPPVTGAHDPATGSDAPAAPVEEGGALVHSSLHIMLATVLTGGLGYVFWALAAHRWAAGEVGVGNAAVSLATALSLVVHLGPAALTIERLPRHEGTDGWGARLWTALGLTGAVSAVVAAVAVAVGHGTDAVGPAVDTVVGTVAFVVGCAAWSVMNVLMYTFVSLRRSQLLSTQNVAISLLKLGMLGGLALTAFGGPRSILVAWAASATLGCVATLVWQLPRAGFSPGRPRFVRPGLSGLRSAAGHHLTSAGGVLTPYVLPTLVAALLTPVDNAYFALTWLMGSLFFIVAPAVSSALFAEGARGADLPVATRKAARLIGILLVGPAVLMLVGGRFALSVIGEDYAREGYLLLVVLVVATLPDAVNNIAVGVYRATGRLARSATLNLGMALVTIAGTVVLAPRVGIVGVGYAWALAQTLGMLASLRDVVRVLRAPASGPVAAQEVS